MMGLIATNFGANYSMGAFSWFNRPGVAIAELALSDPIPPLLPSEAALIASAVPGRAREFAAGRACARRALANLAIAPVAIGIAPDRLPEWPAGAGGSITHSKTHCAAAVFRLGGGIRSIGIDLEPAEPLDGDLVSEICRPEEEAWLMQQPPRDRLRLARAIFSAKESAYKCQYGVWRQSLEFSDVGVQLFLERSSFVATYCKGSAILPSGTRLHGQIQISGSHIACVTVMDHAD